MKKGHHAGKAIGMHSAHDYGAAMRANAEAMMPEIAALGRGAPTPNPVQEPPAMPGGSPNGMKRGGATNALLKNAKREGKEKGEKETLALKRGGKVACRAMGGAGKLRKGEMTKAGAPAPAKPKSRQKGAGG